MAKLACYMNKSLHKVADTNTKAVVVAKVLMESVTFDTEVTIKEASSSATGNMFTKTLVEVTLVESEVILASSMVFVAVPVSFISLY